MIPFARLFAAIDRTNSTTAKVDAMAAYFRETPPADAAWAVFFLTGRRLKRLIPGRALGDWIAAAAGFESWMVGECHAVVGDGAETAALLLDHMPAGPAEPMGLAAWIDERIAPLRHADPERQREEVLGWLRPLDRWGRFTLLKLLTGELRVGVSQTLVVRALAKAAGLPTTAVAARLMGDWTPGAAWYEALLSPGVTDDDLSRPYPFFLASPIENATAASLADRLGDLPEWCVEWKWDGIRAQLVKRAGRIHVWSRGEELITDRFPEVVDAAAGLSDGTVLDGEILAFRGDQPLPFSALQHRIGRVRQVARRARDIPVVFMAFDVLEQDGADIRSEEFSARRRTLERVVASCAEQQSSADDRAGPWPRASAPSRSSGSEPLLPFEDGEPLTPRRDPATPAVSAIRLSLEVISPSWDELARRRDESRRHGVEGLMIKRRSSPYGVGRKRGDWWKWKIDPFTIDAVLIYAQPGSGKRASLLTDYTFGLWDNGELVPVAKAYSGLDNDEIAEIDRWIRQHTVERFGPVRHVEPVHVFELGFEAIAPSSRHRSGVAVRFPRMLRWRKDKSASEADTLETLRGGIVRGIRD